MTMRHLFGALLISILTIGIMPSASADALPSLSMLGLMYRMTRAQAPDDAVLAKQFAEVDRRLQQARSSGRTGELRRELAHGLALAAGKGWSPQQEFEASLVARADSGYVDPARLRLVRLEQIFPATRTGEGEVTLQAALHQAGQWTRAGMQLGKKLRELGSRSDVGPDFIESPASIQVDLSGVADGDYDIALSLAAGGVTLGSAMARVYVRAGLDARVSQLRQRASAAPAELRADLLYPLDFMRKVDIGLVPSRGFDVDAELTAAEAIAKSVAAGKNPFAGRTGDFERHYLLEDAGEIMPYRIYVPTAYAADRKHPLVVALHGLGGNEDSMFSDFYGMQALAEARGYLVVAPMGFRIDGGYGGGQGPDARRGRLSEQDVFEVLARVRKAYNIDAGRIYLMGHSMGAIGTWRLAAKHPDIFAALGPIAGAADPKTAELIRHIPQIVVHGDADRTVAVAGSRGMVEALRKLGAEVNYIEVAGGGHTDIAPPNMAKIFDFFDGHRRQ